MEENEVAHQAVTGDVDGAVFQAHTVHAGTIALGGIGRAPGSGSAAVPWSRLTGTVHGRDEVVASLVAQARGAEPSVVVLHAGGGFGKTTIALALCRELRDALTVWWVDASTATGLSEGLREVAFEAGADPQRVREAWNGDGSASSVLWNALGAPGRPWLLVIDNADDLSVLAGPDGLIDGRGWLRTPPPGCTLLITTRDGRPVPWPETAIRHRVDALSRSDGAAVLLDLCPAAGDAEAAERLSHCLGNLPLALRLAGKYLRAAADTPLLPGLDLPRTFAEYEARWREHVADLAESRDRQEGLGTAWEMTLDLLTDQGHHFARPVLRLLAAFSWAPIPHGVLDAGVLAAEPIFDGLTATALASTLAHLLGTGLVGGFSDEQFPPSVVLHPVIREVTRAQPGAVADRVVQEAAVARLIIRYADRLAPGRPGEGGGEDFLFLTHAHQSLSDQFRGGLTRGATAAALLDAIVHVVEQGGYDNDGAARDLRKYAKGIRELIAEDEDQGARPA
ncbi:putative ATP/GTP binding protein [Actinokineospora spheciospongiae]|uniref:Putative ATP/GTP binding protein n=1 Tax=Actinokineospora spheciospongiae TaxID=909613 RepID=W7J6J1_9PSEU|nr:hypothetical protein [Actinokineospora spheciospongiae]EWC64616.1 putative ATP/GTP binding protein [Actinokineospora spheciospongiae]PWW53027.1 hypothetical protein DFQ13_11616 [Actinokineospora spheciospongiae]